MLGGLATGAHLLWVLIKPSFDGLENVFMLPARNPPFLARRAAMFEGAVLAQIAPVAPYGPPGFHIREAIDQMLAGRADIDIGRSATVPTVTNGRCPFWSDAETLSVR